MKTLFHISLTLVLILTIEVKSFQINHGEGDDSIYISLNNNLSSYSIPDSVIQKFPFQNQNNINRFFPGVVSYFQNFYTRGGENYETGFYLDGIKFNDLFTSQNSFFINPNNFEKIDFYNGFIPNEFGNTSAGLFNYKLKTGGEKLNFNIQHQTDNITFSNDAFSGNKRLGAYFYGYNETNLELSGPLYFKNLRFFVSADYLFRRDKNPQRYPGIENVTFTDQQYGDSVTINLPAGIVPYNSFEAFNLLSTLLLDFDKIKIKVFGIYFDENQFTEREHILQYLNPRLGLIDKSGGIVNINFDHKINDIFSYSLGANYFQKSEMTTDQYLGDNYWTYGDSVANAEAGVVWHKESWNSGRYSVPDYHNIMGWRFEAPWFPSVDFKKSYQKKISFTGNFNFRLHSHHFSIGTDIDFHQVRFWQLPYQYVLAGYFASYRESPNFQDYSDAELKELIAIRRGVNNFGYDPVGREINSGLDKPIEPVFISAYIDDQFNILDNLYCYLGLRYDNFDFDYKKMIDPAAPELSINVATSNIIEDGLINTKSFSFVSPKVSMQYALNRWVTFCADYSQNVQNHPFLEIYQGFNSIAHNLASGYYYGLPAPRIKELKPIVSSQSEIVSIVKPLPYLKASVTVYNKNVENLAVVGIQETHPGSPWGYYYCYNDNGTFDIWGSELVLEYFNKGIDVISNFSYQNTNQKDIDKRYNKFIFNTFLSYNFLQIKNLSGVFNSLNLSFWFTFNSGHPYYLEVRDPNSPYSGTTPNIYQLDLKLEKGFPILDYLNVNLYLYVINLLDTKNEFDVFPRTGTAADDGFINDPNLGGQLVQAYGEQYAILYKLKNQYNPQGPIGDLQQTFYGPPRQIGFGIKLNY